MLKMFGLAALNDIIGFLKKEPSFFSFDENKKMNALQGSFDSNYPQVFVNYLQKTNANDFLKEVQNALDVFDASAHARPENTFLSALAQYLSSDFALKFDHLSLSFFFSPSSERSKQLNTLFPGESGLHQTVREFVFQSTYQEIGMKAQTGLALLKKSPVLLLQTPMELGPSLRQSVRSYLLERYPFSFPEFQVTPNIVGGMRLFAGGQVIDHSWMGRIQSLTNLTQLST